MKCKYCGKNFELNVLGSGGQNREFCYECYPEGLDRTNRRKLRHFLNTDIFQQQKINRGCDICGYNACSAALEWHHPNDDKNYNPGELLKDNKIEEYLKEISKCQLLCSNCHREIHYGNEIKLEDLLQSFPKQEKRIVTEQDIIKKYYELKTYKSVANYFSCSPDMVSRICKKNNIPVLYQQSAYGQKVAMLDKKTKKIIQIFNCVSDANKFLGKQGSGHIASVCQGKAQSAYGYS